MATIRETLRMAPLADRCIMEASLLNQEILRLDANAKQRITCIMQSVRNVRDLNDESKATKEILISLKTKIENLEDLLPRLPRIEQAEVRKNIIAHQKELDEDNKQLRDAKVSANKHIESLSREILLAGGSNSTSVRSRNGNPDSILDDAVKITERASDIRWRMSDMVARSEQNLESLVHSSSVIRQTETEYCTHSSHIQTGNKILYKYERREFTDKILVLIAIVLYITVLVYILQKRVFSRFWLF